MSRGARLYRAPQRLGSSVRRSCGLRGTGVTGPAPLRSERRGATESITRRPRSSFVRSLGSRGLADVGPWSSMGCERPARTRHCAALPPPRSSPGTALGPPPPRVRPIPVRPRVSAASSGAGGSLNLSRPPDERGEQKSLYEILFEILFFPTSEYPLASRTFSQTLTTETCQEA